MGRAVLSVLSRYAVFSGRARRPEFWWWVAFMLLLLNTMWLIDFFVVMPLLGATDEQRMTGEPLSFLVALAMLLPSLSVGVRRLHDTNRSGWWLLTGLIPVVGTLLLLYFFLQPTASGDDEARL